MPNCTCGEKGSHIIMRRTTVDGTEVLLWDNGAVTGPFGYALAGVPIVRPRTPEAVEAARTAGRLLMDEVSLLEGNELAAFYLAARKADGYRAKMWAMARPEGPPCKLAWIVERTTPQGKPLERVAHLPRIRWPGMVVYDFCGGPGSAGGRYALFRPHASGMRDVVEPTGFRFNNLKDLWKHLGENMDRTEQEDRKRMEELFGTPPGHPDHPEYMLVLDRLEALEEDLDAPSVQMENQ